MDYVVMDRESEGRRGCSGEVNEGETIKVVDEVVGQREAAKGKRGGLFTLWPSCSPKDRLACSWPFTLGPPCLP